MEFIINNLDAIKFILIVLIVLAVLIIVIVVLARKKNFFPFISALIGYMAEAEESVEFNKLDKPEKSVAKRKYVIEKAEEYLKTNCDFNLPIKQIVYIINLIVSFKNGK